ncbi:MAG: hypothetical protein QOJ46_1625 [bacterium]|jgi:hypothetical protein
MADSTTQTSGWPHLTAQLRHGPKASVPPALSISGLRRSAFTMHGHLTTRAAESAIAP